MGTLALLRGTPAGLEFVFGDEPFEEASAEVFARLAERPGFYRGSRATAVFIGAELPEPAGFGRFLGSVRECGIELHGLYGNASAEGLATDNGLAFLGAAPRPNVTSLGGKRAAKAQRSITLTETARSLQADFAGARSDIALRRSRGEASVRKPKFAPAPAAASPAPAAPALAPAPVAGTLY
ncbi:MAG TPA: hypothetical protein VKG44_10110, partial [Candidatus Baltobacteraceae bacterium]|nr:hypothetical protein [Candidatus Baltobacteraceae bacterium]